MRSRIAAISRSIFGGRQCPVPPPPRMSVGAPAPRPVRASPGPSGTPQRLPLAPAAERRPRSRNRRLSGNGRGRQSGCLGMGRIRAAIATRWASTRRLRRASSSAASASAARSGPARRPRRRWLEVWRKLGCDQRPCAPKAREVWRMADDEAPVCTLEAGQGIAPSQRQPMKPRQGARKERA